MTHRVTILIFHRKQRCLFQHLQRLPPQVNSHTRRCSLFPLETVFALPLRDDGKIWTGVVTFTASKPIEIEVLHSYDPKILPDAQHGEPYHATLPTNQTIALSTMTMFTDTPLRVTDMPISTGSLVFTGSALVFHKTSGEPFTVTYTVDAVAKKPNHQ